MAAELADWQKRVLEEQKELKGKMERLTAFINSDKIKALETRQAELLSRQLLAMQGYDVILSLRIALF